MAGRKNPFLVDNDNPELTDGQLAAMRPAAAVMPPEVLANLQHHQRDSVNATAKVPITIHVDPETLEALEASGPGWQTRASDVLRASIGAAEEKLSAAKERSSVEPASSQTETDRGPRQGRGRRA